MTTSSQALNSNEVAIREASNGFANDDLYVDQIGKTVAMSLDRELKHLSPKVLMRLESARVTALSQQKKSTKTKYTPSLAESFFNLRLSINWAGMLLITAIVLYFVADWQKNSRIDNIAAIDTAILSDTVPPDAYADEGFRMYLKAMIKRLDSEAEKDALAKQTLTTEETIRAEAVKEASQNP